MRPVSPPSSPHHRLSSSVKNRKEGDDMSCGCDTVSFTLWPSDGREQVAATCRKRGGGRRVFPSLLPAAASVHHHLRVLCCVLCVCVSPLKLQLNTRCYCCCYESLKPRSSQFVGPARSIFFFYKQADKGQPSPSPRPLLTVR